MATHSATTVETVAAVRKYVDQLKKEPKIGHALRRLNRLALTEPIMAETSVGRAVNGFVDHPEHGQLARDLIEKWIVIAAEAKGIVMDEPKPSRKRPADDTQADAPPAKMKPMNRLASAATASAPTTPVPTTPDNTDELFVIERTHSRSKVYSGRQKPADVSPSHSPTVAALLQSPSKGTFEEAEPVLQRCTAEQLERVVLLNPGWERQTEGIWKKLCLRQFPDATARDTFCWRWSYQMRIQQQEDRLAAITRLSSNGDAQTKPAMPLIPMVQKEMNKKAAPSPRAPLAPINGNGPSTPSSKTAALAKRPAPLMAKAMKMMKNRSRR